AEDPHHVEYRNAVSDADGEVEAGLCRLEHRVRAAGWRYEDHRRVRACRLNALGHRVEHRPPLVRRPALARCDAADDVGAVSLRGLGVIGAFATCDALNE